MRKVTCDVIKDLMPLYVDDVLSDDSKMLVEEHIVNCDKCKEHYMKIKTEIAPSREKAEHDQEVIMSISKEINKKRTIAVCVTTLVVAFIAVVVLFGTVDAVKHEAVSGKYSSEMIDSEQALEWHRKEIELKEQIQAQDEENITDVSVNMAGSIDKIKSADIYVVSKTLISDDEERSKLISIASKCLEIDPENVQIVFDVSK